MVAIPRYRSRDTLVSGVRPEGMEPRSFQRIRQFRTFRALFFSQNGCKGPSDIPRILKTLNAVFAIAVKVLQMQVKHRMFKESLILSEF